MEGWLRKKGFYGLFKSYKKRWFYLPAEEAHQATYSFSIPTSQKPSAPVRQASATSKSMISVTADSEFLGLDKNSTTAGHDTASSPGMIRRQSAGDLRQLPSMQSPSQQDTKLLSVRSAKDPFGLSQSVTKVLIYYGMSPEDGKVASYSFF